MACKDSILHDCAYFLVLTNMFDMLYFKIIFKNYISNIFQRVQIIFIIKHKKNQKKIFGYGH